MMAWRRPSGGRTCARTTPTVRRRTICAALHFGRNRIDSLDVRGISLLAVALHPGCGESCSVEWDSPAWRGTLAFERSRTASRTRRSSVVPQGKEYANARDRQTTCEKRSDSHDRFDPCTSRAVDHRSDRLSRAQLCTRATLMVWQGKGSHRLYQRSRSHVCPGLSEAEGGRFRGTCDDGAARWNELGCAGVVWCGGRRPFDHVAAIIRAALRAGHARILGQLFRGARSVCQQRHRGHGGSWIVPAKLEFAPRKP